MIGIIGAMDMETAGLVSLLKDKQTTLISGIEYTRGFIADSEVVVAKSGVGKVFAGICAQTMILKYQPKIIINTGIAGGLDRKLKVYDIVIADQLIQHDFDITIFGYEPGHVGGLDVAAIPCSKRLINAFSESADKLGYRYYLGTIASGDQFISSKEKTEYLANSFKAIACEMEGAAIAQVCYVNKVEFIVIRCISDLADEGAPQDFVSFCQIAAERSLALLREFIRAKA